ncbi:MarR family winged helix-turn-helix transcriptional regulator [Arenibacterium halophilum]|uniref:MarR family winged helix-turn-helix transcriptional regulator n=1 Tax=Arenibacterium halophilum TaxID=2583821 RepID=UPI001FEC21A6|nr:MarR family transcriptional regulator [Arenibacterium halophilum]
MSENRSSPPEILALSLTSAYRRLYDQAARCARNNGLQIEAWSVLETLEAGERLTMGQIAQAVAMKLPALSKLVDRMVSEGLVHRQPSRSDQRQVNLLLTDLGRKRMMQVRGAMVDHDAGVRAALGEGRAMQVQAILADLARLPDSPH